MSAEKIGGQLSRLAAPPVSFKRELEALRAERRVPTFTRELTIGGGTERAVHAMEDRRRELRIAVIDFRLREIRGHVENEFAMAGLESRAARDFERSR